MGFGDSDFQFPSCDLRVIEDNLTVARLKFAVSDIDALVFEELSAAIEQSRRLLGSLVGLISLDSRVV